MVDHGAARPATSDDRRALGGYYPEAGRSAHEDGAPTLIPVPSLLRSLLSDHLDPGYAAAAAERRAGGHPRGRVATASWQVLAAVAVATVLAFAVAQAQATAPGVRETRQVLAGSVRSAEAATDSVTARRDAVATAVTGPGLTVTITDPGVSKDLSDVSKERVEGSRQVILDRDLQLVVNSLWVSDAEAISVGGVRIGPNVTIRQAGGGILVDNQPINSPYEILALGPPHGMRDVFDRSPALQRLRLLETSYGVGVKVSAGDGLTLPAGSVRDVNFAMQIGPK